MKGIKRENLNEASLCASYAQYVCLHLYLQLYCSVHMLMCTVLYILILQDTVLFNDTVMHNIRYGCITAADSEVLY